MKVLRFTEMSGFLKNTTDEKRKIVHCSSQYLALHQYINQYVQMYSPPPFRSFYRYISCL